jgi:hypothetical protein
VQPDAVVESRFTGQRQLGEVLEQRLQADV